LAITKPFRSLKYIYLKSTESTNLFAQNYLSNFNPDCNICIYTPFQTSGRGQIGRFWHSKPNLNLSVSYIIQHNISTKDHFYLSMIFSLAVYDLLKQALPDEEIRIKWPNDVYAGDKKLAGILIQNIIRGSEIKHSILGVGINVNQTSFPKELPNPTSIKLQSGKESDLLLLTHNLYPLIINRLNQFSENNDLISESYIHHLYRYQEPSSFKFDDQLLYGKIIGVSKEGKLQLKLSNGIEEYNFRELEYII